MASTAVALQDLPATDAKLVRYLLLLVALHSRQNLQLATYPFKHLKKSVGRSWMLMADKYGSILNPYYIIYIYGSYIIQQLKQCWWCYTNIRFYWAALRSTGLFCNFTDLEFVSVHENTDNKELGKYLGRTSLVIKAYVFICHQFVIIFHAFDTNECENILCLNALIEATDSIAVVHQDFRAIDVKLVSCV